MRHIIIGTAGHVDHGKTCLTQALTGVNTDRLKEEQKRGITIEIGFAQLRLPNGQTASIIDVPGHEKLIHNMLTGATGIDVVLLVVAADEGFMPQTREHLNILTALGVKNGLIVITKTDLVDADMLELVMDDTRNNARGSFLEGAPILPVSAYTGEGIDELKENISELLDRSPAHTLDKPFRLPVDRVFSVKGFGTVVTGTLIDGTIQTGDEAAVYPGEYRVKVRELQNHDVKMDRVEAGMRVAINLSGLEKEKIARGSIIAAPGSMLRSDNIAVEVGLNPDSPFSVKNGSPLHFYQGTQEKICRIRLLDRNVLEPGEKTYAQLIFKNDEVVARNLDRFIIRFFSPMITVGGGGILDMNSRKLKRNDPATLARLENLNADPVSRILQMVEDADCSLIREEDLLSLSGLSTKVVRSALQQLRQSGKTVRIKGLYGSKAALDRRWTVCEELLRGHHEDESLMDGMHLGELRERAFPRAGRSADYVLSYYSEKGLIRIDGSSISLRQFQANYSPEQAAILRELEDYFIGKGFVPTPTEDLYKNYEQNLKLCKQVLAKLTKDGVLIALTPSVLVYGQNCRKALETFREMFKETETVALGEFRTRMGINRKQAELYLNYFDNQRISRLVGDRRILLKPDKKPDI